MPSKYIVKQYVEDSFYHVFNRGVEKRDIFMDQSDYEHFTMLLDRYLNPGNSPKTRRDTPNYASRIELNAYCLMTNHFHLLIYQKDQFAMEHLMRSLSTAYSMYFNSKYDRVGKLFQARYKAVHVNSDGYFAHISRYIHLNPIDAGKNYVEYPYSSYGSWVGSKQIPAWLHPQRVLGQFNGSSDYASFVADYASAKEEIDLIKSNIIQ